MAAQSPESIISTDKINFNYHYPRSKKFAQLLKLNNFNENNEKRKYSLDAVDVDSLQTYLDTPENSSDVESNRLFKKANTINTISSDDTPSDQNTFKRTATLLPEPPEAFLVNRNFGLENNDQIYFDSETQKYFYKFMKCSEFAICLVLFLPRL